MRILYITSRPLEINTSASIRNKANILGFLENGHEVDLVTTEPDKNHTAYDVSLGIDEIQTKYIRLGGVQSVAKVGRKLGFLAPIKCLVYKFMNNCEVYDNLKGMSAHTNQIDLENIQYDYIISSSDPKSSHLFVYELLKKKRGYFQGKWIQIWGDPFVNDITRAKKNVKKIEKEETKLLMAADKVVYVSKLTLEQQEKMYSECKMKMQYYPIPYMSEYIYELRDLKKVDCVKLVYCGDYNTSVRNIKPLSDAINVMEKVHLTVCGGSNDPLFSTERVESHPRLPYQEIVKIEKNADILVFIGNKTGGQIPGKIYQYSGTNKPILFILDGNVQALKKQFEKFERFTFTLNNSKDIKATIESIIFEGRFFEPIAEFSKRNIAKQIIK